MITKLLLEVKMGFSSDVYTFPVGVVGWVVRWVVVKKENDANSAFN